MRRIVSGIVGAAFALSLTWGATAAPGDRAMVLSAKGVVFEGKPLAAGQTLSEGSQIKIEGSGEVVLLDLKKGQRLRVQGPSQVKLTADGGIQATSGSLQAVEGPKTTLSPSGQNFRRLGGAITRALGINSARLGESDRYGGLRVEQKGKDTLLYFELKPGEASGPVRVELLPAPSRVNVNVKDKALFIEDLPEASKPDLFVAEPAGGATFRVNLGPVLQGRSAPFGVCIRQGDISDGLLICTRFRPLSPNEQGQLKSSLATLEEWIRKDRGDVSHYINAVTLLDDFDQLSAALEWVNRALKVDPGNAGLKSLQLRLLIDSGHYAAASRLIAQGVAW